MKTGNVTPERIAQAKRLISEGHKNSDIAKATGLSWYKVNTLRLGKVSTFNHNRIPDEKRKEIIASYGKMTVLQAAAKFEVSQWTVSKIYNEAGLSRTLRKVEMNGKYFKVDGFDWITGLPLKEAI